MNLTFNQMEAAFTARFQIPADKAVAFRGRLQHLQRLGFPSGVNTGRGTKATYGWTQMIQLMVALDLIDLGLTPDVAAKGVRQNSDRVLTAIQEIIHSFETEGALVKGLMKARCPFGITKFLVASVYALTLWRADEGMIIEIKRGKEFTEQLNKDPAVEPAAIYINLGARLMLVGQTVGETAHFRPAQIATELLEWARQWADEESVS